MTISLPASFVDVSQVRQIPDNQEVFVNMQNDQSVIVELLELEAEVADADAGKHHFDTLAAANEAESASEVLRVDTLGVADVPRFPPSTAASLLTGRQLVAKFNKKDRDIVDIYLAVVRLREHTTDVLVSFNLPRPAGDLDVPAPMDADAVRQCVSTLAVLDYGLFGGS